MANALYPKAKEAFLNAQINLASDTIKISLIDTGTYTYSASHQYRSDVANAAVISTATLSSKTTTNGVFDADDALFTSVTGANAEALIIFQDTGTQSTSRLIAYIDSATGLPILPNGGDITVAFSSGSNKIFSL
jgi:VCBS repeat-containing protein